MTDSETFDDIVASFPFTLGQLHELHERARLLTNKTTPGVVFNYADGTIDAKSWRQLRSLKGALWELVNAAEMLERDADPQDEGIPF